MIERVMGRQLAAAILVLFATAGVHATDSDGDGTIDVQDNCINVANPAQIDSDNDNFGNACDADLNNDGVVNAGDLGILRARFFSTDPNADFNGDGVVNAIDLGVMSDGFFQPPGPSGVAIANTPLALTQVYSGAGLSSPLAMHQIEGEPGRWYVLERGGRLSSFEAVDNVATRKTVMNVPGVDTFFEGGALGFDFDPEFATNGYLYVSYTAEGPNFQTPLISRVSRFDTSIDPSDGLLIADPFSEVIMLSVNQPYGNHNGGNLLFGPDDLLYFGLGDGGSGGDPANNGQRTETLLGAMLRIDIHVSSEDFDSGVRYYIPDGNPFSSSTGCASGNGCPEIFAYGLRNPWRFSFDRLTRELWVGDVGQSAREEIDLLVAGGNYGWRCREGDLPYSSSMGCPPLNELIAPVHDYSHTSGTNSITGGYVYRGSQIPGFQGMYVFSDYGRGEIWGIYNGDYAGELLSTSLNPVSFAEALDGEIYLMSNSQIYRLELAP